MIYSLIFYYLNRSFGSTQQMALKDSYCNSEDKPYEEESCPGLVDCPTDLTWSAGPWDHKCGNDPCEIERRHVYCVLPGGRGCDEDTKPIEYRQCGNITCGVWKFGNWSKV